MNAQPVRQQTIHKRRDAIGDQVSRNDEPNSFDRCPEGVRQRRDDRSDHKSLKEDDEGRRREHPQKALAAVKLP